MENGQDKKSTVTLNNAGKLQEPETPIREEKVTNSDGSIEIVKYKFLGWYLNDDEKVNFEDYIVKDDVTIYAKWNKILDLDNLVDKSVNNIKANNYFSATYENTLSKLDITLEQRMPKFADVLEQSNIFEFIKDILNNKEIESVTIGLDKIEGITLNANNTEILENITEWLSKNSQDIFEKADFNEVILGDLDQKTILFTVKLNGNVQLQNGENFKTYKMSFDAYPITVTLDYGYKEEGQNENKKTTVILETAGKITEPEIPTRNDDTITDEKGSTKIIKYKFVGWFYETVDNNGETSNKQMDFENGIVIDNVTLYAKWEQEETLVVKTVDLDSIVDKQIKAIPGNDCFSSTYNVGTDTVNVEIKQRIPKISDNITKLNVFQAITNILNSYDVQSITISADKIDKLTINTSEEASLNKIYEWINNNCLKMFEKEDFNDVILGDLSGKTFLVTINLSNNAKLENEETSKTYKVIFKAYPIKVTLDYGYKEEGQDENKILVKTLENAGILKDYEIPARNGYRFLGWYKKEDEQVLEQEFDFSSIIYDNINLVAKWFKVVNLDDLVCKTLENADGNDELDSIYQKEENQIVVKINHKSTKFSDALINSDLVQLLEKLVTDENIKTVTITKEGINPLNITGNLEEILNWFNENSSKLLGKESINDAILSDLSDKMFSINIKLKDNTELEDRKTEKTYNVIFKISQIVVTYDYGYDNKKDEVILEKDSVIEEPDTPVRDSYKFLGWYTSLNSDELFDFKNNFVKEDITLYAKWAKIVDIDADVKKYMDTISSNSIIKSVFNLNYSANERNLNIQGINEDTTLRELLYNSKVVENLINCIDLKDDRTVSIVLNKNEKQINYATYTFPLSDKAKMEHDITELVFNLFDNFYNCKIGYLTGRTLKITIKLDKDKSIQNDNSTEKTYTIKFLQPILKNEIDPVGDIINGNVINSNIYNVKNEGNNNIVITPKHSNDKLSQISDMSIYNAIANLINNNQIEKINMKYGDNNTTIDLKSVIKDKTAQGVKSYFATNWSKICCCKEDCCINGKCNWNTATNNCLIDGSNLTFEIKLINTSKFSFSGKNSEIYNISFKRSTVVVTFEDRRDSIGYLSITVPEGLPINENIYDKRLLQYEGHEFKYWCTDSACTNQYIFGKYPVTENLTLYSSYYTIINTDKEIQDKIKSSRIGNIFSEVYSETSRTKNISIILKTGTKDITEILNSAIASTLNNELANGYIDRIEVNYNNKSVSITQANKDSVMSTILSEISGKNIKLPLTSSAANTSTIGKIVGVTPVTIKVIYNKDKVKFDSKMTLVNNYTTTYNIAFNRIVTYDEMYAYGADIIKSRINVNADIKNKISGRVDKSNIYINVSRCMKTIAMNVIPGSGIKTALLDFLNTDCIKGIYLWETNDSHNYKYPSMTRQQAVYLTYKDINVDDIFELYDKFSNAFGGCENLPLRRFVSSSYNIKIMVQLDLADNCRWENGKPLTYTIMAEDVPVE